MTETRIEVLRRLTRDVHDQLDRSLLANGMLQDRPRFARFLQMQYRLHADVACLYLRPDLAATFPGLADRARLGRITADLNDLGQTAPPHTPALLQHSQRATALGWLYVVEGSALGGVVLLKMAAPLGVDAAFGASHLAPPAEGVARHWRRFTEQLDREPLDPRDEVLLIAGARQAFTQAHAYMREAFA